MNKLSSIDPVVNNLIESELSRQEKTINFIASENYTHQVVLQAMGSILTNKYAEGYPGKRYYSGCEFIDQIELLAQERCKKLFGVDHVNVQPHAGSQANMAVFFAALKPHDTIMGMSLAEGGHLTHGHKVNFSGIFYNSVSYTVNRETQVLDYDEIADLAEQYQPKLIICGASAYSRIIDFKRFAEIAQQVNAYLLADIAHIAGLVATGLHPSPVHYADFISSTTHKTLRGPRGGLVMCKKQFADQLDRALMPGLQGGPFMHVIAAKAVAFDLATKSEFTDYQQQVLKNATYLAKCFIDLGYSIVTGGTDNHLFVMDLRSQHITGHQAQIALEKAGITVSKSCIPFDTEKPWITSGIRLGTPAITTREMKEKEIDIIVHFMHEVLQNHHNDQFLQKIKKEVEILCKKYPIYSK